MPPQPNQIESIVLSNVVTGVLLGLLLVICAWIGRSLLHEIATTGPVIWRTLAAAYPVAIVACIGWISIADDWVQLVMEPYRSFQRWDYQRQLFDPVDQEPRTVTIVIVGILVVLTAAMFAKHLGSYGLQLGVLIGTIVLWMPLFIFHQRLNLLIVDGAGTSSTWTEVSGVLAFWVVRESLTLSLIAISFVGMTMLTAPIVTLILDVFHLRRDQISSEADAFFGEVGMRADEREEVSLHNRWRPIRRPT